MVLRLRPFLRLFHDSPLIRSSFTDLLDGVVIPSVHAINQPFLLHVHARRDQCCSSHRGIFGREADLASQEQLHRDAIPWGIDSSVLMLSEL